MNNVWRLTFITLSLSFCALVLASIPLFDNNLHLVVCDVGQGDGILIYQKTTQILIDGGPDSKIMKCLGEHVPFFDRKIDLVILTNPDLDHYGGLIDVARNYEIGLFVWPGIRKGDESFLALEKEIVDKKIPNLIVLQGVTLQTRMGAQNIVLKTLWPTREFLEANKAYSSENITTKENEQKVLGAIDTKNVTVNEQSIVTLLSYSSFDALLTGDVQGLGTDDAALAIPHSVEVLKVPHHGSKNGLKQIMLEYAKPQLAIISDGKNNRFGHPHKETLDLLNQFGVKVLRTDQVGEVEIETDGKSWRVK